MLPPGERILDYLLSPSQTCLKPDQIDPRTWDAPLLEVLQTFERNFKGTTVTIISYQTWTTTQDEEHRGRAGFVPLTIPEKYMDSLKIGALSWGRGLEPDRQGSWARKETNRTVGPVTFSGLALFRTEDGFNETHRRKLQALVPDCLDRGLIWVKEEDAEAIAKIVLQAIQEGEDSIRYSGNLRRAVEEDRIALAIS